MRFGGSGRCGRPAARSEVCADIVDGVPPDSGTLIERHAPHAIVLDDFHHRLLTQSKRTPFPAAAVRRALASTSSSE
ncbi:hypothetical protein [Streptomyces sp. RPT161]|uniref:hypothetical protein n=1 Tax=Streptomyces sp. RPT161 TaxID=3015993 RepID=UPI0022B8B873|nr:hypothetical protein [Streptomyces sp. RPT161]